MIVTLLTDYGSKDGLVGVCHGVLRSLCPGVEIIDITHGIRRHAVRRGALVLRNTLPYMPQGVHVAVVDPQAHWRAVAVRCADGRMLLGPDNGLLSPAWERCGGVEEAVDLARSPFQLEPVAPTFHGRDIFAPVAAHLAAGESLAAAGEALAPSELRALELPAPRIEEGTVIAHVVGVDDFGNAALDAGPADLAGTELALGGKVELEARGECHLATFARTFGDVQPGEKLLYEDSYSTLAVAINLGDAAAVMDLRENVEVRLSAHGDPKDRGPSPSTAKLPAPPETAAASSNGAPG